MRSDPDGNRSGTRRDFPSFLSGDKAMHSVARSDLLFLSPKVAAYPAPLCAACNLPMPLANAFHRPDDPRSGRREYQCRQCGAVTKVRRMTNLRD